MLITAMNGQAALKLENSRLKERSGGGGRGRDPLSVDWENEPATSAPNAPPCGRRRPHTASCGAATIEAALPLVVKGKFRVDRFIGAGGAGVVYHAVDMPSIGKVAIKTLPAIRLEHASRPPQGSTGMATVMHPNLALIYGAEHWKGTATPDLRVSRRRTLLESPSQRPPHARGNDRLGTLLADALEPGTCVRRAASRTSSPATSATPPAGPEGARLRLAAILDRSRDTRTPHAVMRPTSVSSKN